MQVLEYRINCEIYTTYTRRLPEWGYVEMEISQLGSWTYLLFVGKFCSYLALIDFKMQV